MFILKAGLRYPRDGRGRYGNLKGYCTYIRAYLDYLHNVLHKYPEDVSWQEMRGFIRWLQKERSLADRTMNCAISQLRSFTLYVLHKPWDDTQLLLPISEETICQSHPEESDSVISAGKMYISKVSCWKRDNP